MADFLLALKATSVEESEGVPPSWRVHVSLDGLTISEDVLFLDPLTDRESIELKWYLERFPTESSLETRRAYNASRILAAHGSQLFEDLLLFRIASRIAQKNPSEPARLRIDVLEQAEPKSGTLVTFQQVHWESLEASDIWGVRGLTVSVRRVIESNTALPVRHDTSSSVPKSISTALNVLIVIARNTVRSSTSVDVEPTLAYKHLEDVRRTLEARKAPNQLKVEVVRPGTFSAFKEHVQSRGLGYFDLVHFDLHGKIGKRKGEATKTAFLKFESSTQPGNLTPVPARDVAQVLTTHDIKVAILNSCESGRANAGNEANLAKVFIMHGTTNVLAMSYRLLSSGANLLLDSFYNSFLVNGASVDVAATSARAMMRQNNKRSARFAHEVEVSDWIVPVLYCCAHRQAVRVLRHVHTLGVRAEDVQMFNAHAEPSQVRPQNSGQPLVGRDFDLLRFERLTITSRIVGLSAPAGGGKSSFLSHLLHTWQQTDYIESFDFIPTFAFGEFSDAEFESQLRSALLPPAKRDLPTPSIGSATTYEEYVHTRLLPMLSDRRRVLVFDDLQLMFSEYSCWGGWSAKKRALFSQFLAVLNSYATTDQRATKITIILVGRRSDDEWWHKHFGDIGKIDHYELPPMSLTDSQHYVTAVLGVPVSVEGAGSHAESEALENIIGLSQGNPLFLKSIFSVYKEDTALHRLSSAPSSDQNSGHPSKKSHTLGRLYRDLHFRTLQGVVKSISGLKGFLYELSEIISGAPQVMVMLWGLLSRYWHRGPDAVDFAISIKRVGIEIDVTGMAANIEQAIPIAEDRGFLRDNGDRRIEWIHPLFTVAMRAFCASDTMLSISHAYHRIFRGLSENLDIQTSTGATSGLCQSIAMDFIDHVDAEAYTLMNLDRRDKLKPHEYEGLLRRMLYNVLSAISLCANRRPILDVKLWPLSLIMFSAPHLNISLSSAERSASLSLYEELLWRFIDWNQGYAIPAPYQPLVLFIAGSLISFHHPGPYLPTGEAEMLGVQLMRVLDATETAFGPISGQLPLRMKAVLYSAKARLLLADGYQKETKAVEKEAFALWEVVGSIEDEKKAIDELGPEAGERQWVLNLENATSPTTTEFDGEYPYMKVSSFVLKAFGPDIPIRMTYSPGIRNWEPSQLLLAWMRDRNEDANEASGSQPLPRTSENVQALLKGVSTLEWDVSVPGAAITNLDPFSMEESPRRYVRVEMTESQRDMKLQLLEDALSIGDWLRAANLYSDLSLTAAETAEGREYWEYLHHVCQLYGGEDQQRADISSLKEVIEWNLDRIRLPDLFDNIRIALMDHNTEEASQRMAKTVDIFQRIGLPATFRIRATIAIQSFQALTNGQRKVDDLVPSYLDAYDIVIESYALCEPGPGVRARIQEETRSRSLEKQLQSGRAKTVDDFLCRRDRWLEMFDSSYLSLDAPTLANLSNEEKVRSYKALRQVLDELGLPFDTEHISILRDERLTPWRKSEMQNWFASIDASQQRQEFERAAQELQCSRTRVFHHTYKLWNRRKELESAWCRTLCENILTAELHEDLEAAGAHVGVLATTNNRGCFAHLEESITTYVQTICVRFQARINYAISGDWESAFQQLYAASDAFEQLARAIPLHMGIFHDVMVRYHAKRAHIHTRSDAQNIGS